MGDDTHWGVDVRAGAGYVVRKYDSGQKSMWRHAPSVYASIAPTLTIEGGEKSDSIHKVALDMGFRTHFFIAKDDKADRIAMLPFTGISYTKFWSIPLTSSIKAGYVANVQKLAADDGTTGTSSHMKYNVRHGFYLGLNAIDIAFNKCEQCYCNWLLGLADYLDHSKDIRLSFEIGANIFPGGSKQSGKDMWDLFFNVGFVF